MIAKNIIFTFAAFGLQIEELFTAVHSLLHRYALEIKYNHIEFGSNASTLCNLSLD